MRVHVGKHILEKQIDTDHEDLIYGFWGKNKDFYGKIDSECSFYYDYGKIGNKPSRNNQCTNRLLHCNVQECKKVIWSYNMTPHFTIHHPDRECDVPISSTDISAMKKNR